MEQPVEAVCCLITRYPLNGNGPLQACNYRNDEEDYADSSSPNKITGLGNGYFTDSQIGFREDDNGGPLPRPIL